MDCDQRINDTSETSFANPIMPIKNNIMEVEQDTRSYAVVVRNAAKSFGNLKVIDGLNMSIKEGTIYSFLGSSGCGKSTTLGCIVGLSKFQSGKVWVFGKEPGSRQSCVPGKAVGYMPQDYSLYNQLTVKETLMYFGMLNGMSRFEIFKALVFYTDLLQLPNHSGGVYALSGGQQRRVSLVVALMHNPPLVILDEPTVGVDPLLRESILNHLTQLTRARGTTVIITTHYIEGARDSDTIGVMRHGRLIVEKSPKELLSEYRLTSLESVVLQLCKVDSLIKPHTSKLPAACLDFYQLAPKHASLELEDQGCCIRQSVGGSFERMKALVKKNISVWQGSLWMLYMSVIFPATGLIVTYNCFNVPKFVNLGVVNEELNGSFTCDQFRNSWQNHTCAPFLWSCKYLDQLSEPEFVLHDYNTIEDAVEGVRLGEIQGFLSFPPTFSDELYQRAVIGTAVDPENFSSSNVVARLDKSNIVISVLTEFKLMEALSNFAKALLIDCNLDPERGEFPLQYKEPIVGKELTFSDFVVPPYLLGQMFFLPIVSTGVQFVNDKRAGTMQRSLVAGTKLWEIFFVYLFTETGLSILRLGVMYGTATVLLGVNLSGSLALEAALGLLVGISGIAFGFLFGIFCSEEVQVALLALGTYIPNLILSAVIWPLEGMPVILQKIVRFLPCTLPSDAMRSMCNRGWGLDSVDVQHGFVVSISYIVIIFVSVIVLSMRSKNYC